MSARRTKFYLDKQNGKWMGVCSGIADYTGIDVVWVRVGAVLVTLMGAFPWTLIAYFAAAYFAEEYEKGFDVFDLRALAPLRLDTIKSSLARTGRLVVLHEGRRTHGFGAELIARLTEKHFAALKARPLRIGALDLPVPFAPELEQAFRPTLEKVIDAVSTWIG